jgi:multidrug efflux system outer membrane protein
MRRAQGGRRGRPSAGDQNVVSMKRALILTAVLTPLLAACASNARMPKADTRVPAAFEAPQPPAPAGGEAALDAWWTSYNDPQLTTLVEEALANSFDQQDALAKLAQAAAAKNEIYADALPTGALTGSATHSSTSVVSGQVGGFDPGTSGFVQTGGQSNLNASFNVSWELDLFGRVRQGFRVAKANFRNAEFTYEASRAALAANVAQSLFEARGLAIQLQDAEETVRIDEELRRLADVRVSHGLSPSGDLDQADANLGASRAQAESLSAQLTNARRSLLLLVGRGVDPLASLPVPATVGTPPPVPNLLPARLLERRPDVRAAEFAVKSQAAQLEISKLALFPTIDLKPGATLAKTILPSTAFLPGGANYLTALWSLGASATVPILDRPKLIAQIHQQHAIAEQTVIAYEKAVQSAYVDSENALVLLDSDKRRVDILVAAERSAQAAYEKSRIGYARGLQTLQSALIAETTWRNIHSQMTAAQSTLMERSVQAFKALGGGWSPEALAKSAPPQVLAGRG